VERLELSPGRIADIMRRRPLIDEVLGDVSEDRSPDALDRQGCEANAAGDFAVALIRFRESLEIRRQRAHRSGAVADLRLVASSLDQVAQLEDFAGDPDSAMAHRLEALSIRRSIAGDSSSEHLREVASSLHGIGVVELSRRNPDQALKRFREAVKIRRSADRRTTTCESDIQLARSFMCIGDIERDAGAADSALVSYADALELCRRTVGVSFDSVTVGAFCSCLESIAAIELSQKYVERPLERLRESLSARRRLSTEVNSSAAIGRLCDTLELLAEAEFAVRSADAALQGYAESLDRRRDMARSMNTADCVMAIAASLCKAARVELAVGSSAAALEHQRESLDWLRLLPALCGVPAELHCAVNNGDQPIPLVVRITHILQQHVALAPVELVPAIIEVTSGLMSEILMRNLSGLPNTDVLIRTSESLMILRHHSARLKELLRESASRVRGAAGGTHEHVGELQAKLEVERLLLQISRMSSDLRDVAGRPTRRIDRHG
jgi:tetratricopeptide (TPR) repeat protein